MSSKTERLFSTFGQPTLRGQGTFGLAIPYIFIYFPPVYETFFSFVNIAGLKCVALTKTNQLESSRTLFSLLRRRRNADRQFYRGFCKRA